MEDRNTLNESYMHQLVYTENDELNLYDELKFIFIVHLIYKYPEAIMLLRRKGGRKFNTNSKCRNSTAALKSNSSTAADSFVVVCSAFEMMNEIYVTQHILYASV